MATWKKVIVSGSSAELAALKVDNLTSGQVVIGGGSAGNLSTTAINGTGNIVATTGATNVVMSGSFSGSFSGNINASIASASYALSSSYAMSASYATSASIAQNAVTASFATNAANAFVQNGNSFGAQALLGTNDTQNLAFETSGSIRMFISSSGNIGVNMITPSGSTFTVNGNVFATSFTGSLFGTASYASQALSASFASQAASATTASYVLQAVSASFATQAANASSASYALTSSYAYNASTAANASTASFVTGSNVVGTVTSASYALTASFAQNGGTVANALTFGTGLSGSAATFNGSAAVNVAISGSNTLSSNVVSKWTGTGLTNSNITDTGTQVQIGAGASSGVTIAAGGINVTGASTFQNNLTVTGDLSVAGTASFTNTDNLNIRDKFILINSGSSVLADSGWVTQYNAAGSGSAFYLEAGATNDHGPYGRFAVAFDVIGTSTSLTPSEYVVTAKINQASSPSNAVPPTFGTGSNGSGNMWVTNAGDIFIYG